METWQTIGVQLGIAGLVIVVGYRIAILLINTWSHNDQARTEAWIKSDAERTVVIRDGFQRVTDVHASLLDQQHRLHQLVIRLDTKVATALDLTPVHGTAVPPEVREAIETPSKPLDEPKVIVRDEAGRATPPGGVRIPPRHRTSG